MSETNIGVVGEEVNISVTGARGTAGADALERKLAIFRFRADADFTVVTTETLKNNTGSSFVFSFTPMATDLLITSSFFDEKAYTIHTTVRTRNVGAFSDNETVSLNTLALIYTVPELSEWAYIIIEDLTQYI